MSGVNWGDFWSRMWPVVLGVAVLLVIALVWIVRNRMKYKVEEIDVRVINVREMTVANPTMTMARNVPLASAVSRMIVTFEADRGDRRIELCVPDSDCEKMSKGMQGRLRYRKAAFLSFVPRGN